METQASICFFFLRFMKGESIPIYLAEEHDDDDDDQVERYITFSVYMTWGHLKISRTSL